MLIQIVICLLVISLRLYYSFISNAISLYKYQPLIYNKIVNNRKYLTIYNNKIDKSNDIQYPEVIDKPNQQLINISNEDDALYQLFIDQINELTTNNNNNDYIANYDEITINKNKLINQPIKVIENPTILEIGMPIEFNYKGRVSFGIYVGKKNESNGLSIKLPNDSIITIDIGQIISCWDLLADESYPSTTIEWSQIVMEALDILGNMSPRKSNLEEFWKLISKRSNSIAIDSIDLGIYIFQEKCFKKWVNPYIDASESNAMALTAAQRYVAALLLYNDDIHFKRKPSKIVEITDEVHIVEGGYSINDEGIVLFRESDLFLSYYNNNINNNTVMESNPFRQSCITKLLRSLELYAYSPTKLSAPPTIKHLLKRMKRTISPQSAKEILIDIKYNSNSKTYSKTSSYTSITPWSKEVLDETNELIKDIEERKDEVKEISSVYNKIGKRGLLGKIDYRNDISNHPVISIDSKSTTFYDDCFSLSPSTNEILIHIVDVNEYIRKYPNILDCAKERVASTFLPTGPIHMLPPQALEALKLSISSPNEVITVAIKVDFATGVILNYRIFPSIIGPIFTIDMETADELLNTLDNQLDQSQSLYQFGYPTVLLNDLITIRDVITKIIDRNEWVDKHFTNNINRNFKLDRRTGTYTQTIIEKTTTNRMVNALLTMYSDICYNFCLNKNISLPIAWENRDRVNSQIVRRFATQPLRNWLSLIQQKQLRSALKLELPYSRKDCAMFVSYHNNKRKEQANYQTKRLDYMSFDSLESFCSNLYLNGQQEIILAAEGLGNGGNVKLIDFNVNGIVNHDIKKGELVKVKVIKIISDKKTVLLQLINDN